VAIRNRVFQDYLASYRAAIGTTNYAELEELQPKPFASLGNGGAGTAYALWRLGDTRRAKRWVAAAVADRSALAYSAEILGDNRRPSLMFGRPGALWAQAMIAPATAPAYARALAKVELDEYASGAAGHLLAALLVKRDPALDRVIAKLTARVVAAVRARAEQPWAGDDSSGFAHGAPGMCYAALAVAPKEPWLADAVARLAEVWVPAKLAPSFVASWCNGAAGSLMLWTKAFSVTGDARFMDVARRTAQNALDARHQNFGVCCGDAGVAFALLGLDRIDRRGGWRGHARDLAAWEIANGRYVHSNGLFYGHPGIACLAQDLLDDQPRGFPAIEA
jgi:hypothetical protein